MDLGPEATHMNLSELGLPSTIADMKHPTEEYVVTLITEFLNKFNIDVGAIQRPAFDQLCLPLLEDNLDIISLVNLSEAMASICRKIFFKDFHLTDITSPVPKRSRKVAKFMANFLLYATNKMVEIEQRLEENRIQYQHLQELRNCRMALLEAKNEKALRITEKSTLKEQLETKIAKLRMHKEVRRSRQDEVEARLKAAEQEKMEAAQRHSNLTVRATKTRRNMEDIKSKVVTSPERHNALLRDTIEQKKKQSEKRAVMEEALKAKKPAIKQTESCLSLVRQKHAKLSEVTQAYNRLVESKKEMELAEKKIAELKSLIEKESTTETEKDIKVTNAALQETKAQCEEHLSAYRNEQKKLITEQKVLKKKFEDTENRLQEILSKKDEIRASIVKEEDECTKYLKNCLELWNEEIQLEREMSCILGKSSETNLEKKG